MGLVPENWPQSASLSSFHGLEPHSAISCPQHMGRMILADLFLANPIPPIPIKIHQLGTDEFLRGTPICDLFAFAHHGGEARQFLRDPGRLGWEVTH